MIRREFGLFSLNGLIAVLIAYWIYKELVSAGVIVELANGLAYLSGMFYGFFANKRLTFRNRRNASVRQVSRYILLHGVTLAINIAVNSFMLSIYHNAPEGLLMSFLTAISISTVLNFIGLKYWVFKRGHELF